MKKDPIHFLKRCRLCGRCYDGAIDIFSCKEKNLMEIIQKYLSIKVREDDALPKKLCQFCDKKLMQWEKFKNSCENVQVKLIADSLPKKIEATKRENNEKPNVGQEVIRAVVKPIPSESHSKRRKCTVEDEEGGDHNTFATDSVKLCGENTQVRLQDEKGKLTFKSNCNDMGDRKLKFRGSGQQIITVQNLNSSLKVSPELSTCDSKTKVLEITDQEIKDLYDAISMNLDSDEKLNGINTAEINNNVKSGHEKSLNHEPVKKLRKVQLMDSKLQLKKTKQHKEYSCEICEEIFVKLSELRSHLKLHSVVAPGTTKRSSSKVEHQCPLCPQKLTTAFNLHQHLATHSKACNYCCHVCGKLFKTRSSLLNHLRNHILDDLKASGRDSVELANGHSVKLYQCQICDKKFRQSGHLAIHLKIHAGIRRFACGQCDMSFAEKYELRRHIIGVHEKVKRFTCDLCGKQFLHNHNYKNHILQHEGIASFACEFCGKAFVTSHALNRHRRLHTGEKPFVCDFCGKAFRDCSNRKKHQEIHLKEAEKSLSERKPVEEEPGNSPLIVINSAEGASMKMQVNTACIEKHGNVGMSRISEVGSSDEEKKNQEEGKMKKNYINLKTYFESSDVVSLKDDVDEGDNVGSPLDIIPLSDAHNVSGLQQVHASGKFDDSSNPGPLFGGTLFGEEMDLNPESYLLIGDGRINGGLMEGTENDGETMKDHSVWVSSSNSIRSDVALSSINGGDVALSGIHSGDLALNGIQGDIGLNTIQASDITGNLEVGMALCSDFDVNSAMELDSGKDALTSDFPSIGEIKPVEESDKTSDNVLCLQVCILV